MRPRFCFKIKDIYRKEIDLGKEIFCTRIGILVTSFACLLVFHDVYKIVETSALQGHYGKIVEQGLFCLIVAFLVYGNLLYQLTRIGYFKRLLKHRPAPSGELDRFYQEKAPSLTILVPSYKEEPRVIKHALLSAALQTCPNRRIVLLIDDPPNPQDPADLESLTESRRIPREIQDLFHPMASRLEQALANFLERKKKGSIEPIEEHLSLVKYYLEVRDWFKEQEGKYPQRDHTDHLFVELTFTSRVENLRERVENLAAGLREKTRQLSEKEILCEYRRLASFFRVEVTSFERKIFENLSHEPNKAMNLNSYIGLMGKTVQEVDRNDDLFLEPSNHAAAKHYPDADYLITLDADSLLAPDYALRLVHFMEKPGHEKFGVVQTPYSAVPNPSGLLERIAGATTDMQYLIHQGFTRHQATYWVGANALLRKRAVEDIRVTEEERGFRIEKFIQDRTVIEDTESSIDLVLHGWKLYNYPERLSYSATPPDFGSLLIQRRRWSNGGLIVLPKLLRYLARSGENFFRKAKEAFLRLHYLTSPAGVNPGILILLLYPFESNMRCFWLPITAAPYYFFYGRDLIQAGYQLKDLFRVYALNLFLIPVNLAGVMKSIQQAVTGKKIPFGRTPKIQGKTAAPCFYVLVECLILTYCCLGFIFDSFSHRWLHALFSLGTALCFLYAIAKFIGPGELKTAFSRSTLLLQTQKPKLSVPPILKDKVPSGV